MVKAQNLNFETCVQEQSDNGRIFAVLTAIFAIAIFGIPVGILGDGWVFVCM
jgi:hypothetical protein